MKYPPKHYQSKNKREIIEVIKAFPLATLISITNNEPLITHLPLIFSDTDKLVGHIDKFNPHREFLKDNNSVTIIFNGPQNYISPSLFSSKQLPTYNYVRVHLKGTVKAIDSKDVLKESLIYMTEFLEHPNQKFILDSNNPSLDRNLDFIKMFEITITSWEGKFKLSQDKPQDETEIASIQLIKQDEKKVSDLLQKLIYRKH